MQIYCEVCHYQTQQLLLQCSRLICRSCLFNHVVSQITKLNYRPGEPITCPSCNQNTHSIFYDRIVYQLDREMKVELQLALSLKSLQLDKQAFPCSNPSCKNYIILQNPSCNYECQCGGLLFTYQSKLNTGLLQQSISLLFKVLSSSPCPGCGVPIVKGSGCSHMTCSICKHQFCWFCMKNHISSNDLSHNGLECFSQIVMKMLYIVATMFSLLISLISVAEWQNYISFLLGFVWSAFIFILVTAANAVTTVSLLRNSSSAKLSGVLMIDVGLVWLLWDNLWLMGSCLVVEWSVVGFIFILNFINDKWYRLIQ